MFSKIEKTDYPPQSKPVLIWDGGCGFCGFWITRLQTHTQEAVEFKTFQETAAEFPDIPLKEFKKASRLIDTSGTVYSGPDSLYQGLEYSDTFPWQWHNWYTKYTLFTILSDYGYNIIAKNRPFMFTMTKAFFGERPEKFKPYWMFYLVIILIVVLLISTAAQSQPEFNV